MGKEKVQTLFVVILAAGRGKRMGKYTDDCTKAMLPIKEKPIIATTIERCRINGLTDFVIVVGYRKEDIMDYFGDGQKFGIKVTYVVQENICGGTANAVQVTEPYIKHSKFMLIYGDIIPTTQDIKNLAHLARNAMGTRYVEDPTRHGVVELDGDKIINIIEKSPNPPSNYANAGIYVLPNPDIFEHIKKTKKSPRGEYELTDSIQYYIDSGGIVYRYHISGLKDIGTLKEYECIKSAKSVKSIKSVKSVKSVKINSSV